MKSTGKAFTSTAGYFFERTADGQAKQSKGLSTLFNFFVLVCSSISSQLASNPHRLTHWKEPIIQQTFSTYSPEMSFSATDLSVPHHCLGFGGRLVKRHVKENQHLPRVSLEQWGLLNSLQLSVSATFVLTSSSHKFVWLLFPSSPFCFKVSFPICNHL